MEQKVFCYSVVFFANEKNENLREKREIVQKVPPSELCNFVAV